MPTLLVVDDEPNVLYSLEKALGAGDLEVLTASTGQQGIELVRRQRPDAVLLDVRLTDMSGLDVFDLVRESTPDCRSSSSRPTRTPRRPSRP